MRPALLISVILLQAAFSLAQVQAYYSSALFSSPAQGPYIETSLTIVGEALHAKKVIGGIQNSVNVSLQILQDSTIVKANKYNLLGPVFSSTATPPVFS